MNRSKNKKYQIPQFSTFELFVFILNTNYMFILTFVLFIDSLEKLYSQNSHSKALFDIWSDVIWLFKFSKDKLTTDTHTFEHFDFISTEWLSTSILKKHILKISQFLEHSLLIFIDLNGKTKLDFDMVNFSILLSFSL